jgi:hypothetical protein
MTTSFAEEMPCRRLQKVTLRDVVNRFSGGIHRFFSTSEEPEPASCSSSRCRFPSMPLSPKKGSAPPSRTRKIPFTRHEFPDFSESPTECHRLVRWIVTLCATAPGPNPHRMPPACPVDPYALCYCARPESPPNATGSPGGSLRSPLPRPHRIAAPNATGLPGGSLRSSLPRPP